MKKKMMAILMTVLMLGALVAVPAVAEEEYVWTFKHDFEKEGAGKLPHVEDPSIQEQEGEEVTNYVLKIPKYSSSDKENTRFQTTMSFHYQNSEGEGDFFPVGLYQLSFRAYTEDTHSKGIQPCIGILDGPSNTSPVMWNNNAMGPNLIQNTWGNYSYIFYLNTENKNLLINLDNLQSSRGVVYFDDILLKKLEQDFLYVNSTETYASVSVWDNGYYNGSIIHSSLLAGLRGEKATGLSGTAETIRPVFVGRSEDYSDSVTVLHAVYEIAEGKERLYSVEISDVSKNVRNNLISDDKLISIPAKTTDKSYELKSFVWDSMGGLKPMSDVSTLSLAQTE